MGLRRSTARSFVTGTVLVLFPLLTGAAFAADLIISNARLIDGTGADPIDGANIVIRGDRIVAVTTGKPETGNARLIDAEGQTVIPGLIDTHVHFTIGEVDPRRDFEGDEYGLSSDEEMRAFVAEVIPKRLTGFLQDGVTTIVSPADHWPWVIDVRDSVRTGEIPGPRIFVVGPALSTPGNHPDPTVCSYEPWCIETLRLSTEDPDVARANVRKVVASGVDGLKIIYGDSAGWDGETPHMSKAVLQAIVDEGHKQGVPVTAHTNTVQEAIDTIHAGIDVLIHSMLVKDGDLTGESGEDLALLANRFDVPVVTTAVTTLDWDTSEKTAREVIGPSLRGYADAGVRLVFGTDYVGGVADEESLGEMIRNEMNSIHVGGFSNMEILQMITGSAAAHPMIPDSLGTIEPGKIADVLILQDDPLENLSAVTTPLLVIKGGELVWDSRNQRFPKLTCRQILQLRHIERVPGI